MAAVNPGVWGIDIGQCALKALRLEQINGVVTATAFDYVEHPKILSQPDANPDELTREALEKFLSRNPTKGDQIAMSVPGNRASPGSSSCRRSKRRRSLTSSSSRPRSRSPSRWTKSSGTTRR